MCRKHNLSRTLHQPPFELRDIKACIPPHLFKRSLIKSAAYLCFDVLAVAVCLYVAFTFMPLLPMWARFIAWPVWWYTIGAFGTGIWVIAHECGHQGFSDYGTVNDAVGWVFHSILLVPYFSWKYSHAAHHAGTGDLGRDTVFNPPTRSNVAVGPLASIFVGNPMKVIAGCVFTLTFGWPSYLLANASGQKYDEWVNHFNPYCRIFKPHQRAGVWMSVFGIGLVITGCIVWASLTSVLDVVFYYFVPYLVVNMWLTLITYLQHTHTDIPHYSSKDWTFVKGALATIDRDYGLLNGIFHHITDSHVVHHLFSSMPHYNAIQATPYVRKFLGVYYRYDDSPVFTSLYKTWNECQFVEDETPDQSVYYYKPVSERPDFMSANPKRA